MDAIEKRARDLLAAEWEKCGDVGQNVATGIRAGASLPMDLPAIRAIIAALTPPEGHVVVTRDEYGEIVMVSRQNDDHEVLEVIALTTHAGGKPCEYAPPEGYVLVPVEMTKEIEDVLNEAVEFDYSAESTWDLAIHAARPEVPNVND